MRVVVLGAGIFGVTGALELRRRGHDVRLVDAGPLPHPLAASTDISKVVRLEYGADEGYTEMAERALDGWRRWNRELGAELFHECGVIFLKRTPLRPGSFEADSLSLLQRRGRPIERLSREAIRARYSAWNSNRYIDGIHNNEGGYVESGLVVERLVGRARAAGVELLQGSPFASLDGRAAILENGTRLDGDCLVAALGSWTPHALPFTAAWFRSSGMPVFHLRPNDPAPFSAECFPVFGADISETGYYGFPIHGGVVKIANHGGGRPMLPSSPERAVSEAETAALRAFVAETFPALAGAPIVHTRVCVYTDSWDGHFWIARDPDRPGLVLATGGSGHAFKFAPLLGDLIADAVEGAPAVERFRWRPEVHPPRSEEAARHQ